MALSKPSIGRLGSCFHQLRLSQMSGPFLQKSSNNFLRRSTRNPEHNLLIARLLAANGPKSTIQLPPIITKDRLILLGIGGMLSLKNHLFVIHTFIEVYHFLLGAYIWKPF
jgi:hypothetical protein